MNYDFLLQVGTYICILDGLSVYFLVMMLLDLN